MELTDIKKKVLMFRYIKNSLFRNISPVCSFYAIATYYSEHDCEYDENIQGCKLF